METGDTFYIPAPGTTLDSHLWIVISNPIADPNKVVMVNFTKYRADKDQACILDVGDHKFITEKTCVNYKECRFFSESMLDAAVKLPEVKKMHPLSFEVLQRVLDGVAQSRMELDIAQFLADQGVIDL